MIVLVMGVSGAGKTTVGKMLAAGLGCEFLDADDFHPPANVAKMRAGTPLTDADRQPWLAQLNAALRLRVQRNADVVLACSALKHAYREAILRGIGEAKIVYLRGEKAVIAARLAERRDHYMNPVLLESQFALLEEPRNAIVVDIAPDPEEIAAQVRAAWIQ